jgi:hypothetical protein
MNGSIVGAILNYFVFPSLNIPPPINTAQKFCGDDGIFVYRYINGLLIPEIHVVRGKTYTFVVEGGQDPEFAAGNPFHFTHT